MAQTLQAVQRQIEALRNLEEKLKRAEAEGVIARIQEAIKAYGFTPDELFSSRSGKAVAKKAGAGAVLSAKSKVKPKSKSKSKVDTRPQFADGTGNEWVGRGPRPAWLRDALASGKQLSDFAVGRAAKKTAVAIKYRDGANTWTGRGSQPRWLKEALAAGKTIEQFQV